MTDQVTQDLNRYLDDQEQAEAELKMWVDDVMGGVLDNSEELCTLALTEADELESIVSSAAIVDVSRYSEVGQVPLSSIYQLAAVGFAINKLIERRLPEYLS